MSADIPRLSYHDTYSPVAADTGLVPGAADLVADYGEILSPTRMQIVTDLAQHPWFHNTDPSLQHELMTLPQEDAGIANHDGYLADLARRPDIIGGAEVVSMESLARGKFALISVFNINNSGKPQTYEYVSWRNGPESGAKGIVFVRPFPGAEPTHFITLVGESFAPGRKVNDSIGGFADIGVEGVQNMMDRIHLEIEEEIGVSKVEQVVELGSVLPDRGMSNNEPKLFAAFIDHAEAANIESHTLNGDVGELESGALVLPMQYLREFILENTDALFQAGILRAMAYGEIAPEWIMRDLPAKRPQQVDSPAQS